MIKIQWLASIWRQNDQKCWVTSQNIQTQRKTTKPIKLQWIASIGLDVKTIKTMKLKRSELQKWSKSNDLHRFDDLKRSKMLSYVAKHSKQHKTTKPIKLQWIASIGCQNDQNKAKLQMWSKFNDLHRLDVKTIKTKLKLNYKSDQNPMTCIDLTSKRSKMLSYVAKHSNTTQNYKTNQITMNCIDWMSKRSKQS